MPLPRHLLDRGWTRPAPTPRQQRTDVVVGLAAAAACVVSAELWHSTYGTDPGWGGVEAHLLLGLSGLVLAGRRRWPLSTLLVQSALFILVGERLGDFGATFTIQMTMFGALYAAWAWARHPRALHAVTAVVLAAMFGWLVWALLQPDALPPGRVGLVDAATAAFTYSVLVNIVYFGGAIAWGQAAWRSARRRSQAERQQELERRLERQARERAVHDERVRIARDLHDVVAHHISGIGVQAAGAGRVLDLDPAQARAALATIEASSRSAVQQMHQLVGLLRRDDESTRAPQPGLADLAGLVGGTPPVEHVVVGTPFPVPETVALSLFRIGQEAVTNVRRHSLARHVTLTLRYLDGATRAVEVEVVDDGRPRPGSSSPDGGFGLQGIAERAAVHGGEVEIGPRPQGGFRVRVRVPVEAA